MDLKLSNLLADHSKRHHTKKPDLWYDSPLHDLNPLGQKGVFPSARVDELIALLSHVRESEVA